MPSKQTRPFKYSIKLAINSSRTWSSIVQIDHQYLVSIYVQLITSFEYKKYTIIMPLDVCISYNPFMIHRH